MDVPNIVICAAFTRMGNWVGGPVGAGIGALTATTAFATRELSELAVRINEGRVSFHDIWRATTAVEAGLLSYGIFGWRAWCCGGA